jgi:hypothetical protein
MPPTISSPACRNKKKKDEINHDKSYSFHTFYHDSGTSKTMTKSKIANAVKSDINVFTAGKDQPPQKGVATGDVQI